MIEKQNLARHRNWVKRKLCNMCISSNDMDSLSKREMDILYEVIRLINILKSEFDQTSANMGLNVKRYVIKKNNKDRPIQILTPKEKKLAEAFMEDGGFDVNLLQVEPSILTESWNPTLDSTRSVLRGLIDVLEEQLTYDAADNKCIAEAIRNAKLVFLREKI